MKLKEFDEYYSVHEEYIQESVVGESIYFILVVLGLYTVVNGKKIFKPIKKKVDEHKPRYWVTFKPATSFPQEYYECSTEKEAIAKCAFYLGVRRADKNTLYYDDKTDMNKKCILNKGIKANNKITQEFEGTFKELCIKYKLKLKEIDKSNRSNNKKAVETAIKLVKEKLKKNNFQYINKGEFGGDNNDFFDGLDDSALIYNISAWDITPNARTESKSGEIDQKVEPIDKTVKEINNEKLLPKGYKLSIIGDWDDYTVVLEKSKHIKEDYNMDYEEMIDSLNEEFVQELFKYKKVAVDCPVSRKDAYNTAVGVFEKAFSGKYRSYDYCIIKDGTDKMDFLNNKKNKVTLYKFNLTDNYDTTMGYGNNGYQNSITSRSSDEVNKCRAVVRKVVVECNEKLRKLGLFSKSNGFNSTCSVPYYHINYIGNSIILNYNQEYKKVNRKTGEIKESAIEEGYEYCGSFIKK